MINDIEEISNLTKLEKETTSAHIAINCVWGNINNIKEALHLSEKESIEGEEDLTANPTRIENMSNRVNNLQCHLYGMNNMLEYILSEISKKK